MIGRPRTVLVVVLLGLSSACGSTSSATPTPSPAVVFNFAGLYAKENVDQVEGLRTTIMWTVPPKLIPGPEYAVSTWIAFAAPQGLGGVSYRIAQVGWMQTDSGHPRLFWEWGTSLSDTQRQVGADVKEARPLKVEVDWDGRGTYSFYADNVLLGNGSVSWTPTDVGVFAENAQSGRVLAGHYDRKIIIPFF